MDEGTHKALLIGVGETPAAAHRFPPLQSAVTADLHELGEALTDAGYDVETLRDPTRNDIADRITRIAQDAPAGSTLLLYFSGHGVRIRDTDYLLPADALAPADDDPAAWERPHITESLLDADISKYLSGCTTGTVLWLIDACRSPEDSGPVVFGSGVTRGPAHGGFAVMTGCEPGQRCGYTDTGSFFTRALAEAFGPLTEAATVEQIHQTAARRTRELALRHRAGPQKVRIHYGRDLEEETRQTVVAPSRRLLESWREAVHAPELWGRVPASQASLVTRFQQQLSTLAAETARHVHLAQTSLTDPWADDDFPVRLLRNRLPQLLADDAELSALEVTSLIAGVFLHEAAWADRLNQAKGVSPHFVGHLDDGDALRSHYEQIVKHHAQIAEKLSRFHLWYDDPPEEKQAVALWLTHRWIADRFETDDRPIPAERATRFASQLLEVDPSTSAGRTGRVHELSSALQLVAAGLTLGLPSDGATAIPDRHATPGRPQELRIRPLAALLRLAGLLAFDVRTLPDVLAEHLAVSDSVRPQEVIEVLREAVWDTEDRNGEPRSLHLDTVCPHPAVHATLSAVVEDVDELSQTLRDAARSMASRDALLLAGLPARATDRRLRPAETGGRRAYDVPLLRFSLAQTEVRRLLMGEKLYDGERNLALREMYQNAMDACRYREMRLRYLKSTGRQLPAWSGAIRITTGSDDRGRYVECVDNGVGMTVDQLTSTFTRAGRRFEQDRAFRREQAAWLRHDRSLRLYPNSRFGIGVFSYFMLAEEMTITTRPVDQEGRSARRALRVEVPSSGSLFRVQEDDGQHDENLPEGGTRVRLYLRNPYDLPGAACVSILQSLVQVSEFRIEARSADGYGHVWQPGVLQAVAGSQSIESEAAVEAVPGTLWWVKDTGAVLCDGIVTDVRPFGYVLNLTGPHAGELSVNRKKLERYDKAWRTEQWRLGAHVLANWPELDLAWLHRLETRNLPAARTIWKEWRGHGVRIRNGFRDSVDLDKVGWFSIDQWLGDRHRNDHGERAVQAAVRPWRSTVLRMRPPGGPHASISPAGHPVPEPGWADVATEDTRDWRTVVSLAHTQGTTPAEVLRAARGLRVAHASLAGPAVREGSLDWKPTHLDSVILEGLRPSDRPDIHARTNRQTQNRPGTGYQHPPSDLSGIVRASSTGGRELGELAEACARYAPFLPRPLGEVPEYHRKHVCDRDDLALLYVRADERTWRPVAHPWDISTVAETLDIGLADAWWRASRFSWLGRPIPDVTLTALWADVPLELEEVLRRYVVPTSDGSAMLPWAATIDLAAELGISLRKAEKLLAREAERLRLAHQRRYAAGSAGRGQIPEEGTGSVVAWLHNVGLRLEGGISLRDLAFAHHYEMPWTELADAVDELRAAGVSIPNAGQLLRAWEDLPLPSRYAFSGRDPSFDGSDYPVLPSSEVLFTGCQQLRQKLSVLWKTAAKESRRLGLEADLLAPDLSDDLKNFRPTWDEIHALIDFGDDEEYDEWFESPRWTRLTPARLIGYARAKNVGARAAFELLAPLRAIGALIPELTAEAIAVLPEEVPTEQDMEALDPTCRVSGQDEPIGPLDLVSVAGRLGEPVIRTWQRMTPYLPLEPATSPMTGIPDTVPTWQDLTILSEGLNGMLPAVNGEVTRERLAFAGAGVGESPEWVRERLGNYAELFGLELPSESETRDRN
ncbi:caspase family protein [Streptomyces sp. FH025]|uniref:HD domain-containing protein n=1 Tax=Streptomyces sp. FH025 TaxID=2815937 RepID=UPI001A9E0684|nr:caspase family protein [Streptomyces sp. FH025]MBO1416705.1 caspase family protein [Streptomyces sp. FH025]